MQNNKMKFVGLFVIALLAIGGTGAVIVLNRQDDTSQVSETADTSQGAKTQESSDTTSPTDTAVYEDGEYTADGSYRTPGGTETVSVDVTLAAGKITEVSVDGNGTGDSAKYQSMFKDAIADEVVGKNIDEINVSRVSGSSLTSTGFNNAIETIKQEASKSA